MTPESSIPGSVVALFKRAPHADQVLATIALGAAVKLADEGYTW